MNIRSVQLSIIMDFNIFQHLVNIRVGLTDLESSRVCLIIFLALFKGSGALWDSRSSVLCREM